jgi:basic membrane protein A and related proteins
MGDSMFRRMAFVLVLTVLLVLVAAAPLAAQDDQFVFGLILVGPKNDGGWSQAHYEAGQYAEAQTGAKMLIFESLNSADHPETTLEDVVTEMTSEGAKLIITTSDDFTQDTPVVAKAFPDVTFVNMTGSNVLNGDAPANLSNYDAQLEWTEMINGCAAALTTKTGQIGYLGPLINDETRRLADSAYLGAKYCYEKYAGGDPAALKFTVTWIGFWFNIPGVTLDPSEEANSFYDNGADVVIAAIDTPEALTVAHNRAAEGQKVVASAYDYHEGCSAWPEVCIGVPYYNWGPYYTRLINGVKDGSWKQTWEWQAPDFTDINNVDTSSTGYIKGQALTEENSATLDKFIAEMAAFGTDEANKDRIFLWEGPLNYQDGTEFLAKDTFAEPLAIWKMPQLLEGMIGSSTTAS